MVRSLLGGEFSYIHSSVNAYVLPPGRNPHLSGLESVLLCVDLLAQAEISPLGPNNQSTPSVLESACSIFQVSTQLLQGERW